ncbi:hypothetical protein ACS0PU_006463 [Formica fusca]
MNINSANVVEIKLWKENRIQK